MVGDELPLYRHVLILQVMCQLFDVPAEGREFHDQASAVLVQYDDPVIDGVLGVVYADVHVSACDLRNLSVFQLPLLTVHLSFFRGIVPFEIPLSLSNISIKKKLT